MDGFIKANEECFSILPSVYKLSPSTSNQSKTEVDVIETAKPLQAQNLNEPADGRGGSKNSFKLQSTSIIGNTEHLSSSAAAHN